ncbi:MAG: hypothetical protein Q7U34_00915 [Anaerolineales bacterium]|nr:hypothetical protein [Anaerolineales bacterium]
MTAKATEYQAIYKRARTLARKKKEAHVVYYDEDQCRVRVAKLSAWCLWVDTCQVNDIDLRGIVNP